jgi:hypothetical protein
MSPIEPGTLCVIIDRNGDVIPSAVGKTTTVRSTAVFNCYCGGIVHVIDPIYVPEYGAHVDLACRRSLQPILPPGVDTSEPVVNLLPEPVV